jgi:hypothetical protein
MKIKSPNRYLKYIIYIYIYIHIHMEMLKYTYIYSFNDHGNHILWIRAL